MKYLFSLLFLGCVFHINAQKFSNNWHNIYELEKKGSYKDADKQAEIIYKKANNKKYAQDKVRALLYQLKYQSKLTEKNPQQILNQLKVEIDENKGVFKNIYRWYYIKTLYNTYKNNNYYYGNTTVSNTTSKLPADIAEWSTEHYKKELLHQAQLLFKEEDQLKKTRVHEIKELIDYDFIEANLNESVFEFLAYNFINDFGDSYYTMPRYTMSYVNRFDNEFTKAKISIDSQYNIREIFNVFIIHLFQKLEKHYIENNDDFNLDRVKFLRYNEYTKSRKQLTTIDSLGDNLKTSFFKKRYYFEKALFFVNNADKTEHKDYYEKALQLVHELQQQRTENDVMGKAFDLEKNIKSPAFSISLLQEVYENEPVKYLISYRNTEQLHFAYYRLEKEQKVINDSIYKSVVRNQKPVASFSRNLPQAEKYFGYTTEVLGEKMPVGNYLVVAFKDKNDIENSYLVEYNMVKVTNVMLFNKNIENEKVDSRSDVAFYVVHPKTGKPYANTTVFINKHKMITSAEGKVLYVADEKNKEDSFEVTVILPNETYTKTINKSWGIQYVSKDVVNRKVVPILFTDRSIYRPGQEVHFKGILYEVKENQNDVISNTTLKLLLKDDNMDELEVKVLKTNDMGSFSGSFILPKTIPAGDFDIEIEQADDYPESEKAFWNEVDFYDKQYSFKVEEYKRPTFSVEIEEIKKNLFFNEEITIKGQAKSLAGGAIANAEVILNIKSDSYNLKNKFIKKDTLTTDDNGVFSYTFKIDADVIGIEKLKKENIALHINCFAEVKDNAGEVRENNSSFMVANFASNVTLYAPGNLTTNDKLEVNIQASTHNGELLPVTGVVKIFRTLPPATFYMSRPWNAPELYTISEKEFREFFPYETYRAKEDDFSAKELIYEQPYTTGKDKKFTPDISQWKTGIYEVVYEITDAVSQLPVRKQTDINISKSGEQLASNAYFSLKNHSSSSAKELVLEVTSKYDTVSLYLEVINTDGQINKNFFTVADGKQLIKIPLLNSKKNTEIHYQWYFVKNHLTYADEGVFNLPKPVDITRDKWITQWEVWNNKLIPGNQYQWKVKLFEKDTQEAMNGEMLATMYDASLDMILYTENWETNLSYFSKKVYVNFGRIHSEREVFKNTYYHQAYFSYQAPVYFNTFQYFGFSFNKGGIDSSYLEAYPEGYFEPRTRARFYQIEVRDAESEKVISNALVFNIKNADNELTNHAGFSKLWGSTNLLAAIGAVGYEQKRLVVKEDVTVVYLQPVKGTITDQAFEKFRKETLQLYQLHNAYQYLKNNNNLSEKEEKHFTALVLKHDITTLRFDKVVQMIKNLGVFIPLTPDKNVLTYQDEISEEDFEDVMLNDVVVDVYRTTAKPKSSVAASVVTSKTIEGRPNASLVQTLQGQLPGLNITTGEGQPGSSPTIMLRGLGSGGENAKPLVIVDGVPVSDDILEILPSDIYDITVLKDAEATSVYGSRGKNGVIVITTQKAQKAAEHMEVPLRKNLNETAFFFPHIKIQKNGIAEFTFTAPEALTRWRFRSLSHNRKAEITYSELSTQTQKDVMIQPNMPRFVREGDEMVIKARVSNTTNTSLQASAYLRLFNTVTGEDLTTKIIKTEALQNTSIAGRSTNTVSWKISVPENIEGLQYRISVKSGNFTDGEESVIPVLSNRELVTESVPVWQSGGENKEYQLYNLSGNTSETLKSHQFVIEVSQDAKWIALQSLPYLFDYQYHCNEQIFAKYFADVLALHIIEKEASLEELVLEWKKNPQAKLEQNEELKQLMLQETPWMKDLLTTKEKKAQWAAYFDRNRLEKEAGDIIKTLGERQNISGGFGWFATENENEYITQHILVTAAQLNRLNIPHFEETDMFNIINKAHRFLDVKMEEKLNSKAGCSDYSALDYAFVKSYYPDAFRIPKNIASKIQQNFENIRKNWVQLSLENKAKLALIMNRKGDVAWAKEILHQLDQSAVTDETYGMYWKENNSKYYYYYNAAEVQALLIEAFKEIDNNNEKIQKLNAWLLSQKLNKSWGTTKATTSALYAMLLSNSYVEEKSDKAIITVGKEKIKTDESSEFENDRMLGYQTYQWKGKEITNDFGSVMIKNKSNQPLFGGIYWQYFEDLSKIKASEGLLRIHKTYFIENTDKELEEITDNTVLKLGQKIIIRLTINTDKDMEFVHIKDVRAAAFEPVDVLSSYQYKNGLRFYQSTRDAATNFFIDYLSKGKYVIDYEIRLNNEGTFTSGISTVQSMYAPEHSAHSNGNTIVVQ